MTDIDMPVVVRDGEGAAHWWLGSLAEIKLGAGDTGGLLTIVEVTEPPAAEAPLHVHHREDETFWVLEGQVTFEIGQTTFAAGPGDCAFGPRGVPHRYTVGTSGCRMLFILTPGGFESLIEQTSDAAQRRTLPPASDTEPDFEAVARIAASYGNELVDG